MLKLITILVFVSYVNSQNILYENSILNENNQLISPNRLYKALLQQDGNLVIYRTDRDEALFSTCTLSSQNHPFWLYMQNDGNLVLYDSQRNVKWSSNTWTSSSSGFYLEMQDDGNLVLYDSFRKPLWLSETWQGGHNWKYCESTSTSTFPYTATTTSSSVINSNEFVRTVNCDFYIGSSKFVPVGFNAYWLGLDETYTYPSKYRIEEMFKVAQKLSATTIRSHTLGHSSGKQSSLRPGGNTLNLAAWDAIDYAFSMARKYSIRLIAPLTDTYWWYNGNYGDYCFELGRPKTCFYTDRTAINNFKEYIRQWLNHVNKYTGVAIKDDPYLFLIETGNELGNLRTYSQNPSLSPTTTPPRAWTQEIVQFIKSIDRNHLVLDGVDEAINDESFTIPETDVFSRHYYSADYYSPHLWASKAASVNKPFIIGEFDSHMSVDWLKWLEREQNVKGTFFWSMYGHADDGVNFVRHDDGYTLYYKEDSSYADLLKLANHARRMQGLSEINQLP